MDEKEFHAAADKTLNFLLDALEEADARGDLELEESAGVLTITLLNGKQFVVSKHAPTKQLWLSSPVSGGHHFSSPIRGEAGRGAQQATISQLCPPPNLPPNGGGTQWMLPDGRTLPTVLAADLAALGVKVAF